MRFLYLFCFFALMLSGCSYKENPVPRISPRQANDLPQTFFWDGEEINLVSKRLAKNNPLLLPAFARLKSESENALKAGPFSVTHKKKFAYNLHDFYSLSPYFWTNSIIPGGKPYYFRDGLVNPETESENDDRTRYLELLRTLQRLSLTYYFTKQWEYADRASLLFRVWFLDPKTRMEPNWNHAQVIPGLSTGSSLGVIRGTELIQMLDTLALFNKSFAWTEVDQYELTKWFKRYYEWVRFSDLGVKESKMKNNHGTWYDAHVSAVALYIGDTQGAEKILLKSAHKRIDRQIAPDGSQIQEIKRSRSWYYSIYNLKGLFALAAQGEKVGIDLWNYTGDKGQNIRKALDFLIPYAIGEKKWTYEQISVDDECVSDFIPLLCTAAKKYNEPKYLEYIQKLPPLPATDYTRLLYTWQ